jgi:probable addiction module antidote protein
VIESFRRDPELAAAYLNQVLADGDQAEVLVALKRLTLAVGGLPRVAAASGLNATSLYRALSRRGNPELRSLIAILRAMGFRLAVEPIAKRRAGRARKVEAA